MWADETARFSQRFHLARISQTCLRSTLDDGSLNALLSLLIDDRRYAAARVGSRQDAQARRRLDQAGQEGIVKTFGNDYPRTSGTLLPRIAEGTPDHPMHRFVQVGVVIDDHRILATHFGNDALDVILSGPHLSGLTIDGQANIDRSGKGNKRDVGVIHQNRTDLLADARQVMDDAGRHTGLEPDLHQR